MDDILLSTLLTVINGIFIALVVVQQRYAAPPSPDAPLFPEAFTAAFNMLLVSSALGVLDSAAAIAWGVWMRGTAESKEREAPRERLWGRPLMLLVLFWCNEVVWEVTLLSGAATAWHLPNFAGRLRTVVPLRYAAWTSTNLYIFVAEAASLKLSARHTLVGALAIAAAMALALPLELAVPYPALWLSLAAASTALFSTSMWLLIRAVGAAVTSSPGAEATALVVLGILSISCCAFFPAVFFTAAWCGGVGPGTCLTEADEAFYWRTFECSTKVIASGAVLLTPPIVRAMERVRDAVAPRQRLLVRPLPPHLVTSAHKGRFSTLRAVRESLPALVGLPALTGFAAHFAVSLLLTAASTLASRVAEVALALAYAERLSGWLVAATVLAAFVALLNSVLHREHVQSLASSFLPAGFFENVQEQVGVYPEDFDSAMVYFVEEPHVTLMFADLVSFTQHSLHTRATDMMVTLGALFRNLDQLHEQAPGAVKIETVGDQYVSVVGAAGPGGGLRKGEPPAPAQQALTAARLAMRALEATRAHFWPNGQRIEMRIGLHCGSATTGVVGGSLPRWGVFGRSVIVASRMESSGAPGGVHVSAEFAAALRSAGEPAKEFALRERSLEIKGLGLQTTYWLEHVGGGSGEAGAGAGSGAGASSGAGTASSAGTSIGAGAGSGASAGAAPRARASSTVKARARR